MRRAALWTQPGESSKRMAALWTRATFLHYSLHFTYSTNLIKMIDDKIRGNHDASAVLQLNTTTHFNTTTHTSTHHKEMFSLGWRRDTRHFHGHFYGRSVTDDGVASVGSKTLRVVEEWTLWDGQDLSLGELDFYRNFYHDVHRNFNRMWQSSTRKVTFFGLNPIKLDL